MYINGNINVSEVLRLFPAITGLLQKHTCDEDNEKSYCGRGLFCYKLHNQSYSTCITKQNYFKMTCTLSKCVFVWDYR